MLYRIIGPVEDNEEITNGLDHIKEKFSSLLVFQLYIENQGFESITHHRPNPYPRQRSEPPPLAQPTQRHPTRPRGEGLLRLRDAFRTRHPLQDHSLYDLRTERMTIDASKLVECTSE